MSSKATTLAAIVVAFAVATIPGSQSMEICAEYIRPYSDNAYSWGSGSCGFSAAPNVLIAQNVEQYVQGYNWCVLLMCKVHVERTVHSKIYLAPIRMSRHTATI